MIENKEREEHGKARLWENEQEEQDISQEACGRKAACQRTELARLERSPSTNTKEINKEGVSGHKNIKRDMMTDEDEYEIGVQMEREWMEGNIEERRAKGRSK